MLTLHARDGRPLDTPDDLAAATALSPDIVWVDLQQPSPSETAFVERATGMRVPSLAELSEIESSSRLRADEGVLYLSAPLVHRAGADQPHSTPVGFVLAPERLVTVRFEPLTAFDAFAKAPKGSASETLAGLIEAIVDRIADEIGRAHV